MDRALFLALLVPAAAALVPLAHVTAQTVLHRPRAVRAATLVFAALVPLGLATTYVEGISGPETSAWGSEWSLNGPITFVFLALIVIIPALLFSILLLRAGRHVDGLDGRRIRRVGAAVLVYYAVFTLDALALPGYFLVAERLATAAIAWWAYSAYARPVAT